MDTWIIVIGGVLAAAGAVNTLGAAAEKVVKLIKAAKAPSDELSGRVTALETATVELQREAGALHKRLDNRDTGMQEIQTGMSVLYEGMLALLEHGIDGNNIDGLRNAKKKMENHLINK